jgi:hypothetical protein
VEVEVDREGSKRAAHESGNAVGMMARAAPVDQIAEPDEAVVGSTHP